MKVDALPRPADIGSDQPDLDPSTDRYARRFTGPAGEWLLSVQTRALRQLLPARKPLHVLDIGGGHGQIVHPLLEDGHQVTVLASSADAIGRLSELKSPDLTISTGSLMCPPFPDKSFDVVTSFRMMAHIGDWESFLSEMARLAREVVIFDFAVSSGVNVLEPLLFGLKKRLEGDTRRFSVMRKTDVSACLKQLGFGRVKQIGQFALPMVVHRKLNAPSFSALAENGLASIGLTSWIGNPVVMRAERMNIH